MRLFLSCVLVTVLGIGSVRSLHADELLLTPEQRAFPFASEVLGALGDRDDIIWEREIPVRMRDGVTLSTDVIRLRSAGDQLPTILLRTPYTKFSSLVGERHPPRYLLQAGYALVLQNERGTGWSEGNHRYLAGARSDGHDTLTWIEQQPWSNGRVGMVGCSSLGENQLALTTMGHRALRAIIAESAATGIGSIPGVYSQGSFYRGGVPALHSWLDWYLTGNSHRYRPKIPSDTPLEQRARIAEWYYPFLATQLMPQRAAVASQRLLGATSALPSQDVAKGLGYPQTEFDQLITLSPTDPYWDSVDMIRGNERVGVPALYVGTWFDIGTFELTQLYKHMSSVPDQHMIIAPTPHCRHRSATAHTYAGARYVGDARLDYEALYLAWFDRWLRDKQATVEQPKVKVFVLGANEWIDGDQWPVRPTRATPWFLTRTAPANSLNGGGVLTMATPRASTKDQFSSDPLRPIDFAPPSCCSANVVRDQTEVARRDDVLVYTSEPLRQGVAISGEIEVKLFVSADVKDTDLAVKLVDVYPNGPAYNVSDSMLRLRYRDSYAEPRLMEPGKVYEVTVREMVASIYFPPGHRIRLEIAGSNFPNYERNMNTGGRNFDEAKPKTARITLHAGPNRPSRLILPVIENFTPTETRTAGAR